MPHVRSPDAEPKPAKLAAHHAVKVLVELLGCFDAAHFPDEVVSHVLRFDDCESGTVAFDEDAAGNCWRASEEVECVHWAASAKTRAAAAAPSENPAATTSESPSLAIFPSK